jgi:hypothetical protein
MRSYKNSRLIRAVFGLCIIAGIATAAHAEKRALLIGINHYAPPEGSTPVVPAGAHALDSRFAPGASWPSLEGPAEDVASIDLLLRNTYSFSEANITVLPEKDATREGILNAIDKLVADTKPGDLVVFYYSGHGSRRLDTLSSKNHFDETIVPIDAWKGAKDIRDKEMALRFDRIVYDKRAHLTAIYDSCNSGTMARGITASVQRSLPYDDRDVAADKKKDPRTVTEADLKRVPQDGDAIILAAAESNEFAQEANYPDDQKWHGAFTRALVRVLQSSTQTLSADDVVAEVSSLLHADSPSPVPFQQPSVEGRVEQSLFGAPVAAHALHVRVTAISTSSSETLLTLDVGSAGGFDAGTQFTALDAGSGSEKTVIEVKSIDEALVSTAKLIRGPASVQVGQIFELTKMTYPQAARLVIFAPKARPALDPATMAKTKAMFPSLKWVDDPTLALLDFLVIEQENGWVAYNQSGAAIAPGTAAKGTAFLLLGPPQSLIDQIKQNPPFQSTAFTFTQKLAGADYLLATRIGRGGTPEYALFDPIVLAPHKADDYVRSDETDPDDIALNGGVKPEIVCRTDVSLPVRTAWLHDNPDTTDGAGVALAITRRVVRLGKLRVWLQSSALAPGLDGWPYHLAITQHNSEASVGSGPLHPGQRYDVRLVATADQIADTPPTPEYVYLFGFDCAANPAQLYPPGGKNGDATIPQPGQNGVYPTSVTLFEEGVGKPYGADTIFMMATKEKITNLSMLTNDGVLRSRGAGMSRFDELMTNINDAGTRGLETVPTNWLVQQLVVPSKP